MEGDCDPVFQSAFQIVAAIDGAFARIVWDTGQRMGGQSVHIVYDGAVPLEPAVKYYWKVRLWDQNGEAGPFSDVHCFVTSLISGERRGQADGSQPRVKLIYSHPPAAI